ncbi:MAG: hypothetical protein IAC42_01285 [Spirochaetes bacterium]|uniref:Uncharacterized protein n=1 Tax=Candidatus Aphodenecus pullistercoris TaxID=2840669 RepID=A0A9D9E6T3_9SPIR|nr:hypothetical protein [Candidatus Aphodenecus pullistercoris]
MYSNAIVEECKARRDAIQGKRPFSDSFTLGQVKDFYQRIGKRTPSSSGWR